MRQRRQLAGHADCGSAVADDASILARREVCIVVDERIHALLGASCSV